MLQGTSAVGVAGFAGYVGAVDDHNNGEWPDLSGHELHMITAETTEPFQRLWTTLAEDFGEATGASVDIEFAGIGGDYRERIIQLQQAGLPPDLAQSGIDEVSTWSGEGLLGDLTPAMEHFQEEWGEFDDDHVVVVDGEHQLVPLHYNANMYHWRDDVWDVGPRTEPFTWDEQLELVSEHYGTDDMAGGYYPTQNEYCARVYAHAAAMRNEGRMAGRDEDGNLEIVVDSEYRDQWVEMLEWRQELKTEYGILDPTGTCGTYSEQLAAGIVSSQEYFGARPKQNSIAGDQPWAEHVRSAPEPQREGSDGPTMGLVQGLTTFEGADIEAANEFVKFMLQPEYLIDYYMATPIHNAPTLPEIVEHELFQEELEELPDEWIEEDYLNHLEHDNWMPAPLETDPINEHYWGLFMSDGLWHMMWETLEEERDPGEAVDEGAEILRETLEDLQG